MTSEIIIDDDQHINTVIRYTADEGKVFDWKDLSTHTYIDEQGHEVIEHLYAKILYIGNTDTINNYIEIVIPSVE